MYPHSCLRAWNAQALPCICRLRYNVRSLKFNEFPGLYFGEGDLAIRILFDLQHDTGPEIQLGRDDAYLLNADTTVWLRDEEQYVNIRDNGRG